MPHFVLGQNLQQSIRFEYPGGVIVLKPYERMFHGKMTVYYSITAPKEVSVGRIENVRLVEKEIENV